MTLLSVYMMTCPLYMVDTILATKGSSVKSVGKVAQGPSVSLTGPELEPTPSDSWVRSRGTRFSVREVSLRLSPLDSSNFGGPGMPSKSLREGFLQRNWQRVLEDQECYRAILTSMPNASTRTYMKDAYQDSEGCQLTRICIMQLTLLMISSDSLTSNPPKTRVLYHQCVQQDSFLNIWIMWIVSFCSGKRVVEAVVTRLLASVRMMNSHARGADVHPQTSEKLTGAKTLRKRNTAHTQSWIKPLGWFCVTQNIS